MKPEYGEMLLKMAAVVLVLSGLAIRLFAGAGEAVPAPRLTVEIMGLKTGTTGFVFAAMCADVDEFAGKKTPGILLQTNSVSSNAVLEVALPAPGRYAVRAFQDVNSNGRLDSDILGRPREPYAFSNGASGPPGLASWRKAGFEVSTNSMVIRLVMKE